VVKNARIYAVENCVTFGNHWFNTYTEWNKSDSFYNTLLPSTFI